MLAGWVSDNLRPDKQEVTHDCYLLDSVSTPGGASTHHLLPLGGWTYSRHSPLQGGETPGLPPVQAGLALLIETYYIKYLC